MTDIPSNVHYVPSRLGVSARLVDGELVLDLTPTPEVLQHGMVRTSVLSFVVDAVSGVVLDNDPDMWTFTSDMSLRVRPMPAPALVSGTCKIVRQGRRSATCTVELTTDQGAPVGSAAIGFARVPRKEGDPPKPILTPQDFAMMFRELGTLSKPLREEAGIEVVDPANGVVQVVVTPELRNPAGTLQGAMVALVAESAAEDLVATRFGTPVIVTDLDLRYLGQAQVGPIRTSCRQIGDRLDSPIEVELTDTSTGKLTTLVYARAVAAPDF
jgi:acyl-coenzyme A thioesterase PaaI-like protein